MEINKMKVAALFIVATLVLSVAVAGCTGNQGSDGSNGDSDGNGSEGQASVKIFHAGSLAVPFEEIESKFEEEFNVDVQREAAGSVTTVRKVTDAGKVADVVAVADYTLIPSLMFEEYADWYGRFAKNQMVLAYNEESKFSEEINSENWYRILQRDGVKFGFSDPNQDPCGYRSQMVIELAEFHYGNDQIFENLIESNSNIKDNETEDGRMVLMPESSQANPSDKIMLRPKETDLVSGLETGSIDYFFIYRSVAQQHDFEFVQLPTQIDLSSVEYTDFYKKAVVKRATGEKASGKPIVYGITIPKNAENPELAAKFVEFALSETGDNVMQEMGQPPITPAVVNDKDKVPDQIKDLVTEG